MKYCWKEIGTRGESQSVSCIWLCEPMDCSPPGTSVYGILQAKILEWVAISFSRGSSWLRDWTQVSSTAGRCLTIWATREDLAPKGPVQIKIKQKFREIQELWSQISPEGICLLKSWVCRLNLLPHWVYARSANLVLHLKILLLHSSS